MKPYAMWTLDCQGKQDFDGPVLSVSTRYYPGPGGGGTLMLESGATEFKEVPYGKQPTAHCSILLNIGPKEPHDGGGDYLVWRDKHFTAPTEAETKALVEAWAAEQMAEIIKLMGGMSQFKAP